MSADANLSVTTALWAAAFSPIVVLLLLLVWRRWSSSAAAPIALAVSVAVAMTLLGTPLRTIAVAAGKGIWDALFIVLVVWPALILYNVAHRAGAFQTIQSGVRRLIPDRLLVVLVFAWVLTSFVQAIAGFGAPLAVSSPILLGLGVRPVYAVLLPIIGGAWSNAFGTLATTWLATMSVVQLDDAAAAARYAALLLWIPNVLAGVAIAYFYGGWWAIKRAAPAIAVISLLHGGLQLLLVPYVLSVANFIACAAALVAALLLSRWRFYRQEDEDEPDRIFEKRAQAGASNADASRRAASGDGGSAPAQGDAPENSKLPLWAAFAPYALLGVLATTSLAIPAIRGVLERFSVGLPFPEATTAYGVTRAAQAAYSAFRPLTHPGTFLLVSAIAGYLFFRARDVFPRDMRVLDVIGDAARDALPVTTSVTALLILAKVMDHSGQITVLGLGVAEATGDLVFLAASNFIGILGSFITSSNTASNVLFAPLQLTAAEASGLPGALAVGAQTAGGATGQAISPGDALLGATVVGISERLGDILRRAVPWTLAAGALVGGATVLLYSLGAR